MNNQKKILSIVLALILALGALTAVPIGASAARVDLAASGDSDQIIYTDINGNEYVWEYDRSASPEIISVITEVDNVSGELVLPLYLTGEMADGTERDGGDRFYFADSAFDTVDKDIPITSIDFSKMYSSFGIDRFMDNIDHFMKVCPVLHTIISSDGVYEIEDGVVSFTATPDEADSNESYIELNGGRLYYSVSEESGGLYYTRAEGLTGDVVIPDHINGCPVINEKPTPFIEDLPELTSLTVPAGLTFYIRNCPQLKTITFLGERPSVNGSYVKNCPNLEDIDTPECDDLQCENGLLYNGSRLVLAMGKSGDYTIPGDVTVIEEYAFSNCPELSSITIPASVTKWFNAFAGHKKLKEATVCEGVTNIDSSAFQECTSLEKIYIPSTVKRIGYWAFLDCVNLKQVNIPSSVTEVLDGAFWGTGLSQITLPPEVTTIDDFAFGDPLADREKNESFTIKGVEGSAAEEYATKWGFTFVPLSGAKRGDADGDGEITLLDATLIQRYEANMLINVDEASLMCADVDENGTVDIIDTSLIQRWLARMETPYPIGQLT